MGYPTKIATCCFCGTRAALRLDRARHELACASCGAPLRDLKMLPRPEPKAAPAVDHRPAIRDFPAAPRKAKKSRRKSSRRRKGWLKDIAEELFDVVEDIFD